MDDHEKRTRILTEKHHEEYLRTVDKYNIELSKVSRDNDRYISIIVGQDSSVQDIEQATQILQATTERYQELSDGYMEYLKRKNTLDSQRELSSHCLIRNVNINKIEIAIQYAIKKLNPENQVELQNMETRFEINTERQKGLDNVHLESDPLSEQIIQEDVKLEHEETFIVKQLLKSNNIEHSTRSISSSVSSRRSSSRSSSSSILMRQRAKMEAAKAKMSYISQETAIIREKAELKAKMALEQARLDSKEKELSIKREVAVAEAELRAMEDYGEESIKQGTFISKHEQTARYILEYSDKSTCSTETSVQQNIHNKEPVMRSIAITQETTNEMERTAEQPKQELIARPEHNGNLKTKTPSIPQFVYAENPRNNTQSLGYAQNLSNVTPNVQRQVLTSDTTFGNVPVRMNVHAKPYLPIRASTNANNSTCMYNPHYSEVTPTRPFHGSSLHRDTVTDNLVKFLVKKDLLASRFYKYDDKPENYVSWKHTFHSIIREIDPSPSEEIDLLLQYTGPESHRQVKSIKVSNAGNPVAALKRAWERLDSRYGSPERVDFALKRKLAAVQRISYKDKGKLFDLSDILSEIRAVKERPEYSTMLSFFDTPSGINPTVSKLPPNLQAKWRDKAAAYKRNQNTLFPPFDYFCDFIQKIAEIVNDPSFDFESSGTTPDLRKPQTKAYQRDNISVSKTSVTSNNEQFKCIIHKADHTLDECRAFRNKTQDEKRTMLKQNGICYRCCKGKHLRKDCDAKIKCLICNELTHTTAMHRRPQTQSNKHHSKESVHGEESSLLARESIPHEGKNISIPNINSSCTEICEGGLGKSCAKIVLVNIFHALNPDCSLRTYAIIDEQSTNSLIRSELLDYFNISTADKPYILNTCSGKVSMSGRRASGFVVESLDSQEQFSLPTLIECDMIPNNRNEIPTSDVASKYEHLTGIAHHIPPLDPEAEILLLIGRDLIPAHYVLEQKIGNPCQPYAQKLKLGWVIVGESCLNGAHIPKNINAMKTFVYENGRHSVFEPCSSKFHVSDHTIDIFQITQDDNKPSLSVEDQRFLELMSKEMCRDENHNWVAPLPFKPDRKLLPNNRSQAMNRAKSFDISLHKDPIKKQHVLDFMQALFDNGHAERAPELDSNSECWYLPLFGIYHPQKKDSIRIVFDSSAKFQGTSLNDVLMTGPNLTNNLVGILMRFRTDNVAVIADLKQMFYSFYVRSDHRNYLRFIWHEDNNISKDLVDYRMKVHVFGNSPSPAVATCGLRKTADLAAQTSGMDVKDYIYHNFYVDDALSSHGTSTEAVSLLKRTQSALQDEGNLRLHKICSNSSDVLKAFDKNDLAKDLKELDFEQGNDLPQQRTLGVSWNLSDDAFTYHVNQDEKPFTRRGVLSLINGLYDPLGFAAPVILTGKLLLREAMSNHLEWDQPLPDEFRTRFETWKESLKYLEQIRIPRVYGGNESGIQHQDLLVFTDASERAVAAGAYIHTINNDGTQDVRLVLGKAKVAPKNGHTIPRLELCGAVLGVELYETIQEELNIRFNKVLFFTDSKVTLGYIYNETKRFFVYVRNRVDRIRKCSSPSQWNYVPSSQNPADDATRSISPIELQENLWLKGPNISFLNNIGQDVSQPYPLLDPEQDCEVRVMKIATCKNASIGCHRFERFSTWISLLRAFTRLKSLAKKLSSIENSTREDSQLFILKTVQREIYPDEISALENKLPLARNSAIRHLSPFLDVNGLFRVGGRLNNANLSTPETNPIIVPKHHVSVLLIRHYHEKIYHQGRQFTENAVRQAGFWLIGGKRLISSFLFKCIKCRRFRGKQEFQRMADLPFDRLTPAPPFSYIGVDVFGPWTICSLRTRGGLAHSKRWALIFTCLLVRAVHIEILEELSSSCFINALRRFCSIRGEVKIIRSDCGTNFIRSVKDLNANVINIEDRPVKDYLVENAINWIFNPPHSSHMGGTWERMIGVARRIIDSMLLNVKQLTHDMLTTLMAEVSSMINSRPLLPVSYDPQVPFPLSPATLLTLKSDHAVKSFRIDEFSSKDLFKKQWKSVQHLANQFWHRWKTEFLPSLQARKKWQQDRKNLKEGDIVLLCDKTEHRNNWPIAIVVQTYASDDNRVRKVDVRLGKDRKVFSRPVNEVIVLLDE